MLRSYLDKSNLPKWQYVLLISGGLVFSFILSNLAIQFVFWVLKNIGISLSSLNQNVLATIVAFLAYAITLIIYINIIKVTTPRLSSAQLGMSRMPVWSDLVVAPLGFILYFMLSAVLVIIATIVIPGFDASKQQDIGFTQLSQSYEALVAFATLVVLAPIAEEILFRGYLFGALKTVLKSWQVVFVTALLFAILHGSLNVGIDTFALGIILGLVRLSSGSIWPAILIHMMKNSVAFYLVFINPSFLTTIGG